MKQLSQIIAFFLLGTNSLQIIVTICSAIMLIKILVNKLGDSRRLWKIRKQNRKIESDMWAIE